MLSIPFVLIGLFIFYFVLKNPIYGIYLTTLSLPILVIPPFKAISFYIVIFDVFFFMTVLSWSLSVLINKKKIKIIQPEIFISLFLFYLACLVSFLVSFLKASEGIMQFSAYLYGGIYLFIFLQTVDNEKKLKNIIKILAVSFVLVISFGLIQLISLGSGYEKFLTWHGSLWKITSTFRAPNQLVSYLCPFFPFLLVFSLEKRNKIIYFFLIFLILASSLVLFSSGSRTGVFLLFLTLVLFFFWKIKKLKTWRTYAFLVSILFLIFCLIPREILISSKGVSRAFSVFSSNVTSTTGYSQRYEMFLAWREITEDYPLLGIGIGNFPTYFVEKFPHRKTQELHNTYLGIWAEIGTLGFLTFFLFLIFILIEIKKAISNSNVNSLREIGGACAIGVISLLIYGISHFGLRQRQFWFFIALLLTVNNIKKIKEVIQS